MLNSPTTLRSSMLAGTIDDILSTINDIGKYMVTIATGLSPFTGRKTVGWEEANLFARPAADTMSTTLESQLKSEQIATMATELVTKAKSLLLVHAGGVPASEYNTQITRYITAFDSEVSTKGSDIERVKYTIWLYLMSQLEYMELTSGVSGEKEIVSAKIKACLNELVTGYLNMKGWVGFSLSSLFGGSNMYLLIGGLLLAFGILTSSKHTKVGL